jgi:hypothetical protein
MDDLVVGFPQGGGIMPNLISILVYLSLILETGRFPCI